MDKKRKIGLLITAVIILIAPILVLAAYFVSSYVNTVVEDSNEVVLEQDLEGEVEEDTTEIKVEEESESDIKTNTEVKTSDQVFCDHDVDCFLSQLQLNHDVHLFNETSRYIMPGISAWSGQNVKYTSTRSGAGELSLSVDPYVLTFEDGWENLPNEMLQDPYYQRLFDEAENADFLTEEELSQLDEEERDSYLNLKEQGLTAAEIVKINLVKSIEQQVKSTLDLDGLRVTCTEISPNEVINWTNETAPHYDLTVIDFDTKNCSVKLPAR